MKPVVIPHRLIWWMVGVLVGVAAALVMVNGQAAATCEATAANRATLRNLIDVPRNAPGGPAAYLERQRAFYASIGFTPAQTQLVLDAAAVERRRLLAQLGPDPDC